MYDLLIHFQGEVNKHFAFLADFDYAPDKIETGRSENFLDYFCNFSYVNGETSVSIDYSTDIINGRTIAFPQLEQEHWPVYNDIISCSVSDSKAYMSVDCFAQKVQKDLPDGYFIIAPGSNDIKGEIGRVVLNYSIFFQSHLTEVLKKVKIYSCYIDRFYDLVFEEKFNR